MKRNRVELLGVKIDNVTPGEAIAQAESLVQDPRFHQVVTVGPEFLLEARDHQRFREILNHADLVLPEGMGLKVGGTMIGKKFRGRVPGADFIDQLMELSEQKGYRVFLYGAAHPVAEAAAQQLLARHPKLSIVGVESGHRGWWKLDERRLIEKIHRAKPHILLVALGAPKQELWIDRHRAHLHDVRLAIGVGRTFNYLAGNITRAPRFMRRLGLEWLHTFLFAHRYYQPEQRRQRVRHATWHFIRTLWQERRHG